MSTHLASRKIAAVLASLLCTQILFEPCAFAARKDNVQRIRKLISRPAMARDHLTQTDIALLSNDIMDKELDLMKLSSNLKLHQLATPWAGRRWWMYNVGGIGLTAVGAYLNGATRFAYLHKNRINKVPKYQLPDASICRITANCIVVGGGLIEEASLAFKAMRDKHDGVDLKVMRKYADSIQNDVDTMLTQRETLVEKLAAGSPERKLYEQEGRVLRDVRNLSLNEFVRYYADSKSATAFFASSYLWAAASNFVAGAGGIVGYQASLTRRGTARQRVRRGGTGGITDIVSGSMNMATPLVVRLASFAAEHSAKGKLCKELDCSEPGHLDSLHTDQEELHQLVSTTPETAVHGTIMRDTILAKTTQIFDEHEKLRLGDVKAKKRRLVSQLIFFSGIGPPKMVNGITTTIGAFKYTAPAAKQKQYRTIGYGAYTYGIGYSVAMAELIRNQLMNEIRSSKAKKAGKSSGQILKRELGELDLLTENLETNGPGIIKPGPVNPGYPNNPDNPVNPVDPDGPKLRGPASYFKPSDPEISQMEGITDTILSPAPKAEGAMASMVQSVFERPSEHFQDDVDEAAKNIGDATAAVNVAVPTDGDAAAATDEVLTTKPKQQSEFVRSTSVFAKPMLLGSKAVPASN